MLNSNQASAQAGAILLTSQTRLGLASFEMKTAPANNFGLPEPDARNDAT